MVWGPAKAAVSMLAVACIAVGLAACGSTSGTSGQTGEAGGAGGKGGTLTIGTPVAPPSLDPATGMNEYSDYFNLAYEPLIVQAPDGSFKPGLAKSWRYGPENKSFSIELEPGLKFSDGTPVDAKAVKNWIEYEVKLPGGPAPVYFESLKSIALSGPLKLTMNFSSPTPLLELVFSQVLEMGMVASPKAVAAESLDTSTAGAGPYMLEPKATVTGSEYVFVPNPHYQNQANVHWQKVVVKAIANPTASLQALQTGQIQVAVGQPTTSVAAAEGAGLKKAAPLTLLMGLSLMDREGKLAKPLANLKVRQALNYAIDREALAKVIGAGQGKPITQMAVPGDDSYDAALEDTYPYEPEKARELLREAGYPNGFSMPTLSVTSVEQDKLAQALAAELKEVGVTLELEVKSDISEYITLMSEAKYPTATIAFGTLPAALDYKLLWGPFPVPFNPFMTPSPQLAKLDEELSAAPPGEAGPIAREMQKYTVEEAWFAPAVATPLVVLYSPDVTGVVATPHRHLIYTTEIAPAG